MALAIRRCAPAKRCSIRIFGARAASWLPFPAGRGSAWFVGLRRPPVGAAALSPRRPRRANFARSLLWSGEDRVRAFAEWRLLFYLAQRGLNVPKPVAAFYRRAGLTYRCDLITQRIAHAEALSAALASTALGEAVWRAIGAAIARLHRHGVDHADLNAHNILLEKNSAVSVIDFDRGRLRAPGAWTSEQSFAAAALADENRGRLAAGSIHAGFLEIVDGRIPGSLSCASCIHG